MTGLSETPRFTAGDAFYAALVDALDTVGDEGAVAFLGRLTLILANEVGDADTLSAALAAALPSGDDEGG